MSVKCPECGKPHTLSKHVSHEERLARWRAKPPIPAVERQPRAKWPRNMKQQAPKPHPWENRTDLLTDLRAVGHGCVYRLYDTNGVIIYVGQTKGPLAVRLAAHTADKSWWPEVASVRAYRVRTTSQRAGMTRLNRLERAEIRLWEPKYNRVRYGKPLSARVPANLVSTYRRFGEPGYTSR